MTRMGKRHATPEQFPVIQVSAVFIEFNGTLEESHAQPSSPPCYIVCDHDGCDTVWIVVARCDPSDWDRVREEGLRSDGWSLRDDSDKDYCADCVSRAGLAQARDLRRRFTYL